VKKILSIFLLFVSLICVNGCKCNSDVDFAFFKEKTNSIDGYKYYIVSQSIYNEELLLYKSDKNVYLDGEKEKILLTIKEINGLENEELYTLSEEEYYRFDEDFYYKENNEWKIEKREVNEGLGISISRGLFEKYKITVKKGNKFFAGEIKQEALKEFLGFEIEDASNVILNIEINSSNKVKNISLEYKTSNNNNVTISIKVGYSQVIKFKLPTVE